MKIDRRRVLKEATGHAHSDLVAVTPASGCWLLSLAWDLKPTLELYDYIPNMPCNSDPLP